MQFYDETAAVEGLADFTVKGGITMFNALKYIYSLTERDFYNINVKDVFRVILNNIESADSLRALGLKMTPESTEAMKSDAYNAVLPVMVYALAVRLPVLKNAAAEKDAPTDDQIYRIYQAVIKKGGENTGNIVTETFLESKYLIRKGKKLPAFTADWYKSYIFSQVPALSDINNRNIFLWGIADIFFSMYYACFEEALFDKLNDYIAESEMR
ncbi:MAG: hypothetical protein LBL87_01750 [Ruminococcus sp.]|jgi:hypothetical protein|nr:hypothetical protein [Ruminococcus sp.]